MFVTGGIAVQATRETFRIGQTNGSVYTNALMQPYANHSFELNVTAQDAAARRDSTTLRVCNHIFSLLKVIQNKEILLRDSKRRPVHDVVGETLILSWEGGTPLILSGDTPGPVEDPGVPPVLSVVPHTGLGQNLPRQNSNRTRGNPSQTGPGVPLPVDRQTGTITLPSRILRVRAVSIPASIQLVCETNYQSIDIFFQIYVTDKSQEIKITVRQDVDTVIENIEDYIT